jgi:hypothetical protein
MATHVIITTEFAGLHCWPNAPVKVGFLRNPHRHLFKIKVSITEDHDFTNDERETEFLLFKQTVDETIASTWGLCTYGFRDLGSTSCENIARTISDTLRRMKYTVDYVEVFEDGENGARVD